MACNTRTVVEKVLDGQDLDSSLVDYIVGVMDDDDFEFGDDGNDAFDAIGHLLVR
jgi:ATP-binding cassette, subfamily F, member 3